MGGGPGGGELIANEEGDDLGNRPCGLPNRKVNSKVTALGEERKEKLAPHTG